MRPAILDAPMQAIAIAGSVCAASAGAETFWSASYGKLLAFELDFDSGAARYVMQATGDSSGSVTYFAVASEPGTGELLVFYYEPSEYRLALGRLRPGSSRPELMTLLPATYDNPYLAEFSPAGVLYAVFGDNFGQRLATVDTLTGAVTPVLTSLSPGSLSGFGFDPVSGKLFLSGTENCFPICTWFLDTLSIPGHQRERVLGNTNYVAGDPLFSAAGEMLVMDTNFYRIQGSTLVYFSNALQVSTPFGPGFMPGSAGSPAAGTQGCLPSSVRGCLQNRRFAVEATYDATDFGRHDGNRETAPGERRESQVQLLLAGEPGDLRQGHRRMRLQRPLLGLRLRAHEPRRFFAGDRCSGWARPSSTTTSRVRPSRRSWTSWPSLAGSSEDLLTLRARRRSASRISAG